MLNRRNGRIIVFLVCIVLLIGQVLPVSAAMNTTVETKAELVAFLRQCAYKCDTSVSFSYGKSLASYIEDIDWFSRVLYESGVKNESGSASWQIQKHLNTLTFTKINYFPEFYTQKTTPVTFYTAWDDVVSFAEKKAQERSRDFVFYYDDASLDLWANTKKVSTLLYASGIDSFEWEFSRCRIHIYDVSYDEPFALCKTENDVRSYLASCANLGLADFKIYCSENLYHTLRSNSFARLESLEGEARILDYQLHYNNDYFYFSYSNTSYAVDAQLCDTVAKVRGELDKAAAALQDSVTLFCDASMYTLLAKDKFAALSTLTTYAGIDFYHYSHNESSSTITLSDIVYRPGFKIRSAYQTNQTALLSSRERAAFNCAADILNGAPAFQNILDAEKWLHDYLCKTIVYYDSESDDEHKSAIGALLNKKANCSGYADAFCLLSNLAGLTVGYEVGEAPNSSNDNKGHAWNTILLNNKWYLLDTTWDDKKDGTYGYTWYNLGSDIASSSYRWDTSYSPYSLAKETKNVYRPRPIFKCNSLGDLADAIHECRRNKQPDVDIYFRKGVVSTNDRQPMYDTMYSAGVTGNISCTYSEDESVYTFVGLQYK